MGTEWRVQVYPEPGAREDAIRALVETTLARIVAAMSTWEPESEISRFNRAAAGSSRVIGEDFRRVLACAIEIAEASGGAFDPTVGPSAELWGFGAGGPPEALPGASERQEAREGIGHARLYLLGRALVQPGRVRLDLSGIAKGYAVDAVCEALAAAGHREALVEIGGELRGLGVKPDGSPWWVELERPPGAEALPLTVAALFGGAVATSGDYRRQARFGDGTVSHTIDPRTGDPVESGVAAISVFAPGCMEADGWATALAVLGPEEGLALAARLDLPVLMRLRRADGFEERLSPALAAWAE